MGKKKDLEALKAFVDNITPENVGLSSLKGRKRLHGTCRSSCNGRFDIKVIEQSKCDLKTIKVTDRREVALRDDASKEEEIPELVRIVQRRLADTPDGQEYPTYERLAAPVIVRDVMEEDEKRKREKAIAKSTRQHTRERRAASRRYGGPAPDDKPLDTGSGLLSRAAARKLRRIGAHASPSDKQNGQGQQTGGAQDPGSEGTDAETSTSNTDSDDVSGEEDEDFQEDEEDEEAWRMRRMRRMV